MQNFHDKLTEFKSYLTRRPDQRNEALRHLFARHSNKKPCWSDLVKFVFASSTDDRNNLWQSLHDTVFDLSCGNDALRRQWLAVTEILWNKEVAAEPECCHPVTQAWLRACRDRADSTKIEHADRWRWAEEPQKAEKVELPLLLTSLPEPSNGQEPSKAQGHLAWLTLVLLPSPGADLTIAPLPASAMLPLDTDWTGALAKLEAELKKLLNKTSTSWKDYAIGWDVRPYIDERAIVSLNGNSASASFCVGVLKLVNNRGWLSEDYRELIDSLKVINQTDFSWAFISAGVDWGAAPFPLTIVSEIEIKLEKLLNRHANALLYGPQNEEEVRDSQGKPSDKYQKIPDIFGLVKALHKAAVDENKTKDSPNKSDSDIETSARVFKKFEVLEYYSARIVALEALDKRTANEDLELVKLKGFEYKEKIEIANLSGYDLKSEAQLPTVDEDFGARINPNLSFYDGTEWVYFVGAPQSGKTTAILLFMNWVRSQGRINLYEMQRWSSHNLVQQVYLSAQAGESGLRADVARTNAFETLRLWGEVKGADAPMILVDVAGESYRNNFDGRYDKAFVPLHASKRASAILCVPFSNDANKMKVEIDRLHQIRLSITKRREDLGVLLPLTWVWLITKIDRVRTPEDRDVMASVQQHFEENKNLRGELVLEDCGEFIEISRPGSTAKFYLMPPLKSFKAKPFEDIVTYVFSKRPSSQPRAG